MLCQFYLSVMLKKTFNVSSTTPVVLVRCSDGYICTGEVSLITCADPVSGLRHRPTGSNCTIGTDGNTMLLSVNSNCGYAFNVTIFSISIRYLDDVVIQ